MIWKVLFEVLNPFKLWPGRGLTATLTTNPNTFANNDNNLDLVQYKNVLFYELLKPVYCISLKLLFLTIKNFNWRKYIFTGQRKPESPNFSITTFLTCCLSIDNTITELGLEILSKCHIHKACHYRIIVCFDKSRIPYLVSSLMTSKFKILLCQNECIFFKLV